MATHFDGDIYFLVTTDHQNQPSFSSIFCKLEPSDDKICLQMIRDVDWSFHLPTQLAKHSLYKYIATEKNSPWGHKCKIFKEFINKQLDNFTLIGEFIIDPESVELASFKQKYQTFVNSDNIWSKGMTILHSESICLETNTQDHKIVLFYDAKIYSDNQRIDTIISHPSIEINHHHPHN